MPHEYSGVRCSHEQWLLHTGSYGSDLSPVKGIDDIGHLTQLVFLIPIQSHLHQLPLPGSIHEPVTHYNHIDDLEVRIQLSLCHKVDELIVLLVNLEGHMLPPIVICVLWLLIKTEELDMAIQVGDHKILISDRLDSTDVVMTGRGLVQPCFVITLGITEEDVAFVSAHNQIVIDKSVAGVIGREQLSIFLGQLFVSNFQIVVIGYPEIPIAILSRDQQGTVGLRCYVIWVE